VCIAFLASTIAHWGHPLGLSPLSLMLAAVTMLFLDMLTASFEISSMSGESLLFVFFTTVRESVLAEIVQYVIGFAFAFTAEQFPWVLFLFFVPTPVIYVAFKNIKEMRESTRKLMEDLADAVDLRDPYTGGHSRRVAQYCANILRVMQLSGVEADLIVAAARVHDIGKMNIPPELLNKPGALTPAERELMQAHADAGANLLARYGNFARGREIVRHHHERWDGQGYPHQLKGVEIPLGARVIAVADSFDAMTTDRPYRKAMTARHALLILEQGKGQQWDPHLVDAFASSLSAKLQPEPMVPSMETETVSAFSFAS
jgi:putative nucleotidyltransferase with HDIG domain